MVDKNCSRCHKPFNCCNEKPGCWCERLTLDTATLAGLEKEFDNCLCIACLKLYAAEE
jgi:hypothetical protein